MNKPTPAPWQVEIDEERYGVFRLENYGHDAMATRDFDRYVDQFEADRALIEAAPDLLAALEAFVDAEYDGPIEVAGLRQRLRAAHAAIAKAREEKVPS